MQFNILWNPHYDFSSAANTIEIARQQEIDRSGVAALPGYKPGGGEIIRSPWGSNQTTDAGQYLSEARFVVELTGFINPQSLAQLNPEPKEFCNKVLVVQPGAMLSLQRHRGRQEIWEVSSGILTVIVDGMEYEVSAGKKVFIPTGAPHCMVNMHLEPVTVHELQTGLCREGDNVRLLDFSDRIVYPLTSKAEFASAKLYARMRRDLASRKGYDFKGYSGL